MSPRTVATIDLAAIRANVESLRARTPAAVMAVVKADGYGHGLVPSARAALAGGAAWLAVAFVEEALALRAAGVTAPVLALVVGPGERLADAVDAGIDLAVGAPWLLAEIAATGRTARIHVEVDTGLSRGGAVSADWADLFAATGRAEAAGAIELVGLWSHLACSDQPSHEATKQQLAAYEDALAEAARHGLHPQVRHLANSGGVLAHPDTHFDLVRPGIAVYGLPPGPDVPATGLVPAMTLRSRVAVTKRVPEGTGVSYGLTRRVAAATGLAVVPVGYGDGVPRHASDLAQVWLGGARRPILGRVCMDQFVVGTGDDPVAAGDPVVLFGPGTEGEPTADEWAESIGTIGYEIVTRVGARVPREYVGASDDGQALRPSPPRSRRGSTGGTDG